MKTLTHACLFAALVAAGTASAAPQGTLPAPATPAQAPAQPQDATAPSQSQQSQQQMPASAPVAATPVAPQAPAAPPAPQSTPPAGTAAQNVNPQAPTAAPQTPIAATLESAGFNALDRDANGFLSVDELRFNTQGLTFDDVDIDSNLQINGTEWDRSLDFARFRSLDRNRDGILTTAEAHVALEGDLDFVSIDADGNGQVSDDEWRRRTLGVTGTTALDD